MQAESPVLLITGATQGIGAACVDTFRSRGARIVLVDRAGPAEDAVRPGDLFIEADLTNADERERVVDEALSAMGRIDTLVNSAGIGLYAPATESGHEHARHIFELNVFAALHLAQLVAPQMRARGSGSIVNLGSIGGLVSLPWSPLYCASKSALHAVSEGLRRELGRDGIHVLTVVPGIVATRFRQHVLGGKAPERVEDLRNVVRPTELAQEIVTALARKRRFLYRPRIGRLFAAIDQHAPAVMDWFLRRMSARADAWQPSNARLVTVGRLREPGA